MQEKLKLNIKIVVCSAFKMMLGAQQMLLSTLTAASYCTPLSTVTKEHSKERQHNNNNNSKKHTSRNGFDNATSIIKPIPRCMLLTVGWLQIAY